MKISAFLVAGLVAGAAQAHASADPWRDAARQDVAAAFRIFRDNHPGWFDPKNRGFRSQLAQARLKGLAKAETARSFADYAEALGAFSAVLADGHARLVAKPPDSARTYAWPRFITAWRGSALFVESGSPPPGVQAGDRIIACDGRPIRQVIAARLRSQGMRVGEPGHWWSRSPATFVDSPTMGTPHPRSCIFRGPHGVREARLNWTTAPPGIDDRLRAAANGERSPIGLTEPRPGLFMVGLSDFNPDEAGIAAFRQLYSDLSAQQARLLHARAIILDLRWNDGGSSDWPRQTGELLWGKDAVGRRMNDYLRRVQIWWRASAGNVAYLKELESGSEEGEGPRGRDRLADRLEAANSAGKAFYIQPAADAGWDRRAPSTDFATPVYVIVPGGCASACLDAVDLFRRFDNVKLIGAPSAGDTLYLDARAEPLPSGHGLAVVPLKIWMDRPRGAGKVYKPDIEIDNLDWSSRSFLDAVEKDLARNRRG